MQLQGEAEAAMDPPCSSPPNLKTVALPQAAGASANVTSIPANQSVPTSATTPSTNLQLRPQLISTFGFRLANNAVAVQVPNSTAQNIQVARGAGIPLVTSSLGASGHFTLQPTKISHTGFPAGLVGQQLTLQRLPAKGQPIAIQRLPSGSVLPLNSSQVVGLQRPTSSGKIIPLRQINPQPLVTGQHRLLNVASSVPSKPLPSSPATIIAVSQPQQMAVRIPHQQSAIQRMNNPVLSSVQVPVATQPGYIQCIPNAGSVSHGFISNQGGVRTQATIVSSQALMPGQQIVQPRIPNLICAPACAVPTELTHVTSTSTITSTPSQISLSTSAIGSSSSSSSTIITYPTVPLSNVLRANVPVITRPRGMSLQGLSGKQLVQPLRQLNPELRPLLSGTSHQKLPQGEAALSAQVKVSVPLIVTSPQPQPVNIPTTSVTVSVTAATHPKVFENLENKGEKSAMTPETLKESTPSTILFSECKTFTADTHAKTIESCAGEAQIVKLAKGNDNTSQVVITVTKNSANGNLLPHLIGVNSASYKQTVTVGSGTQSTDSTSVTNACEMVTTTSSVSVPTLTVNYNGTKSDQAGNDGIETPKQILVEEPKGTLTADAASKHQKADKTEAGDILTDGFIDSNLLEWDNGVGTLCGTNMKFKINEFGDLELMDEGLVDVQETQGNVTNEPGKNGELQFENGPDATLCEKSDHNENVKLTVTDPSELSERENDPICCCIYCGSYGYKSNFKSSGKFCSQHCVDRKNQPYKIVVPQLIYKKESVYEKKITSDFDWDTYLAETGTIGAPRRLFKEPFPSSRNGFRIGMRLEGVDPKHQSLICVLSVAELQGYRLRLHFDGYSECYDFWVNCDSPLIFPVGWAEKNGKTLQPPKTMTPEEFNWTNYLKETRAVAAPKNLFVSTPSTVTPSAFRVGMKLEAVDKRNQSLIGVATVADTLGEKVLIHFDGWEDNYDYWCDITSPNIHPVGWCASNNHSLTSPPDFGESTFSWDKYLSDTNSTAVPIRAFKTRPLIGFEHGMKVELVDKRNPILIRVASIVDVQGFRLLMHFDGWDSIYDYWIDEDSPDLHPPHWCEKTRHVLQPPIDKKLLLKQQSDSGGCPTLGCSGIGHIKGARYTGHHSAFGCPYSETNMSKESTLTDRLGSSRSEETGGVLLRHDSSGDVKRCPTVGCDGLGHVTGKFTSHHCLSGCPLAERNQIKVKQEVPVSKPVGRPGRGRKRKIFSSSSFQPTEKAIKKEPIEETIEMRDLCASVHESVFQTQAPSSAYSDRVERSLCWEQHARLLPGVEGLVASKVAQWSASQVAQFVQTLTGQEDQASKFLEQEVDGDSLLLLQQSDLLNFLHIKLGPAVKIFNSILAVRATAQ